MKSFVVSCTLLALCAAALALPVNQVDEEINKGKSSALTSGEKKENLDASTKGVVVEASNMPADMQAVALGDMTYAYDQTSTIEAMVVAFVSRFTGHYLRWDWEVVANYEYLHYKAQYYIRFKVDGDTIFVFSSKW